MHASSTHKSPPKRARPIPTLPHPDPTSANRTPPYTLPPNVNPLTTSPLTPTPLPCPCSQPFLLPFTPSNHPIQNAKYEPPLARVEAIRERLHRMMVYSKHASGAKQAEELRQRRQRRVASGHDERTEAGTEHHIEFALQG